MIDFYIIGGLIGLFLPPMIITRLTIGDGRDYPEPISLPLYRATQLGILAAMEASLGDPAVSVDGRIFFILRPLSGSEGAAVYE